MPIRLFLVPNYNCNNSIWDTNSYWIEICAIYSDQGHLEISTEIHKFEHKGRNYKGTREQGDWEENNIISNFVMWLNNVIE